MSAVPGLTPIGASAEPLRVKHSLGADTDFVVRNTFITVEDPNMRRRDSRRLKTVQSISPASPLAEESPSSPVVVKPSSTWMSTGAMPPQLPLTHISPVGQTVLGSPITVSRQPASIQPATVASSISRPVVVHQQPAEAQVLGQAFPMARTSCPDVSQQYVVKNTFIEGAEDDEVLEVRRTSRRVKTLPSSKTAAVSADLTRDLAAMMSKHVSAPPTPVCKSQTETSSSSPSRGPQRVQFSSGAEPEPARILGSTLQAFSCQAAPVVVKNTFIDVKDTESPRRLDSRRHKTTPVPQLFGLDADEDGCSPSAPSQPTSVPYGTYGMWTQALPVGGFPSGPMVVTPNMYSGSVAPGQPMAAGYAPAVSQQRAISAPGPQGQIIGSVWALSQDPQGCRQVQDSLENSSDEVRLAIARELHGKAVEALYHPHANFVLRKCVEKLAPQAVQFIIDEIFAKGSSAIAEAARHRYGCRILETLYERCPQSQLAQMTSLFLADPATLCGHMYGNFVMQRILQHGTPEQKSHIVYVLCAQAGTLGPSFYASAVFKIAMKVCSEQDCCLMAHAIDNAGVLPAMSKFKHGPEVVEAVIDRLDETRKQAARAQLAMAAAQRQQQAAAQSQPKAGGKGQHSRKQGGKNK